MAQPRGSDPVRRASGVKVTQAKKTNPGPPVPGKIPTAFYDGITVVAKGPVAGGNGPVISPRAADLKVKAQATAQKTVAKAKTQSKKAAAVVRRHPWSFISILSTLPILLIATLFSTIACPPPSTPPSLISRSILSPLGLKTSPHQHSELHRTLCYPANIYHDEVLSPYIYPAIAHAQALGKQHPIYKRIVEPNVEKVRATGQKIWEGPVRPVVTRIERTIRKFYLKYVQPRLPYLRARCYALTQPYTQRISALHQQYLAPHVNTAGKHASFAWKKANENYRYIQSHPLTGQASKYANHGYRIGKKRSTEAYKFSRPHVIRGGKEAERIAREILGPRAVRGIHIAAVHVEKGWEYVKAHLVKAYYTHLDPIVGPHFTQLSQAATPYTSTFTKNVFTPYLRPALEYVLPGAAFLQQSPRSFRSIISDFLPSPGTPSHITENKGQQNQMNDFYAEIQRADQPANVPVPDAKKAPAKKGEIAAGKMDRAEMERVREAIKTRVQEQGQKGYEKIHAELLRSHREILSSDSQFPTLSSAARRELDNEFEYVLKGLDKLYTSSTVLKRDQVRDSGLAGEGRARKTVDKVKARVDKKKVDWFDAGKAVVKEGLDGIDKALGREWEELAEKMAWIDGVTTKDWTRYNTLHEDADQWRDKYISLHRGLSKDRQLNDPSANIDKAVASLQTELDDVFESFRERVKRLQTTAYDRIQAREIVGTSSSSSSSRSYSSSSSSPSSDAARATILPIAEAVDGAGLGANGIIGKGKEQILEAFSQAGIEASQASTTASGVSSQVSRSYSSSSSSASDAARATILPIVEAVGGAGLAANGIIGKGKEQILQAFSQAGIVASQATTTASGVLDQVSASASSVYEQASIAIVGEEVTSGVYDHVTASASSIYGQASAAVITEAVSTGIIDQVKASAASVCDQAASGVHQGTRSISSAFGATPSPEGLSEHAESILAAATLSAASLLSAASQAVHLGTKSVKSAAGAQPTADTYAESAQSLLLEAVHSAESILSVASQAAGSAIHHGTRSVISAVGATPSPESPTEHLESIAGVVAQGYASVVAGIPDYHQATRSLSSAVYATPTPELLGEHAESIASVASASANSIVSEISASASSLASEAYDVVHDKTRSISRVVGATPTPETPGEYAQSIAAVVSASASSISSVASVSAASVATRMAEGVHSGTRSVQSAVGIQPTPETPSEHLGSIVSVASSVLDDTTASASSIASVGYENAASVAAVVTDNIGGAAAVATDQAILLASSLSSALNFYPTPTSQPILSSISAYLSSISASGSSLGVEALSSGSSLLTSFQIEASSTIHTATRSLSKAVGATPTPEGLVDVLDDTASRVREARRVAESLVRKHAGIVGEKGAEATEGVKSVLGVGGRDEL